MRWYCNRRNNEEVARNVASRRAKGLLACAFTTLGLHTPGMLASRCFGAAKNPIAKITGIYVTEH